MPSVSTIGRPDRQRADCRKVLQRHPYRPAKHRPDAAAGLCSSTRPTTTAVRNSWIGPDSMTSDAAAKATAMVATAAWPRPLDICDTNQPTREWPAEENREQRQITYCAVVGVALMKTSRCRR